MIDLGVVSREIQNSILGQVQLHFWSHIWGWGVFIEEESSWWLKVHPILHTVLDIWSAHPCDSEMHLIHQNLLDQGILMRHMVDYRSQTGDPISEKQCNQVWSSNCLWVKNSCGLGAWYNYCALTKIWIMIDSNHLSWCLRDQSDWCKLFLISITPTCCLDPRVLVQRRWSNRNDTMNIDFVNLVITQLMFIMIVNLQHRQMGIQESTGYNFESDGFLDNL